MVHYEDVRLSYDGGGMVCKDAGVCGGGAEISVVGVFVVWFGIIVCCICTCKKVMV